MRWNFLLLLYVFFLLELVYTDQQREEVPIKVPDSHVFEFDVGIYLPHLEHVAEEVNTALNQNHHQHRPAKDRDGRKVPEHVVVFSPE